MPRRWKCDDCENKGRHECLSCSGTGLGRMLWDTVFGEDRYITITCEACNGRKIVKCQDCNRKWFREHPHEARTLSLLNRGITAYIVRRDIKPLRLIPRGKRIEVSYILDGGKWSRGKESSWTSFSSVKGYLDLMERLVVSVSTKG